VENLKANTPFLQACTLKELPLKSGKSFQMFSWNVLAADTTPAVEGTVGTGVGMSAADVQVSIGQYTDFASISDLAVETAIDPIVEDISEEFGYRAALTCNTLVQTEFDAAVTADATTNYVVSSGNLTSAVVRQRVADLQGRNARGIVEGRFLGFLHPFVAADLLNDTATNSFVDIVKRIPTAAENLLLNGSPDNLDYEILGDFGGVRWISTTTCPTVSGVPASGDTAYNTYILAKDAVFAISLGAQQLPKDRNYKLMVSTFRDPSRSDPAGVIAAIVSYNFKFVASLRPGSTMVLERIQSMSATT
jgi:N4-gp56 family major capsid protein